MAGFSAVVPDIEYWRENIPCQYACPVQTDARGYVRAIADGDDERAYLIARGPNPLASICGRVCGAPCETDCRRGELDEPISIRALKRYACEQFGPEGRADGGRSLLEFLKEATVRHALPTCGGEDELLPLLQALLDGGIEPVAKRSVGIIGSGPAGLAAAHDLALLGFDTTIYEMEPVLAGMLAVGVPEYRLPRDVIRAEVEVIEALGVKAVTSCTVGKDISFPALRDKHEFVVVAVGAKKSRMLPIPGADAERVIGGVEFLRDVCLGQRPDLGERVVVIGGGNVAYDVGRSVLRQISIDAARTAKRAEGVGEVVLCSLESLEEMPADDIEIIEGQEEGVVRRNSLGPKEIVLDEDGRVKGVVFQRCLRVFDENRRFNPLFDENDLEEIPCDTVLISIGQDYDLGFIDAERDGLEMTERGLISCNPETGATSAKDVFVAGDLAYGTKLIIHAIASGKAVAREIYRQATGRRIETKDVELHFPDPDYDREADYEKHHRIVPPTTPPEERIAGMDRPVELNYDCAQARSEAGRCLNCGINTIFDGARCILCGGCVDVCPSLCLRIVHPDQMEGDPQLAEVLTDQLGTYPPDEASVILKDETICIRCALCAQRCPTGAITMEQFTFKEVPSCQAD
ncbi:MAG: 4Fe-4S ferredoxin [Verrucomicrobia bacterium]|nr:MAG: 4Fe-4S ferredoxin [Verrucomicrobiota bacterium]